MKRNRVVTGMLVTVMVLAVLAADYYFLQGIPSAVLLAAVAFAASYELCVVLGAAGMPTFPLTVAFSSFIVALTPALAKMLLPGVSTFAPQAGLIFLFVILSFALALRQEDPSAGAKAVVSGTFVLVYVGFALSFLVRLRGLEEIGWALLIFALACAKGGDMGAYFVGRALGRHPLSPRLSPKKTVEGAVGAVLASLLCAFVVAPFTSGKVGLGTLLCWAAVLSVAAQFGDLAESLLKRAAALKDSSAFFGHMGGTLDVVDSLLLCAPTAYILAVIWGFSAG